MGFCPCAAPASTALSRRTRGAYPLIANLLVARRRVPTIIDAPPVGRRRGGTESARTNCANGEPNPASSGTFRNLWRVSEPRQLGDTAGHDRARCIAHHRRTIAHAYTGHGAPAGPLGSHGRHQ